MLSRRLPGDRLPGELTTFLIKMGLTVTIALSILSATLSASEITQLKISKGKGEACVDDKDFMRLNHMDLLRHDRNLTVHKGDRNIKYSLKKCISCHAIDAADGTALTATDPKHFCRNCHDYAAVSIDCFECHASRPEQIVAKVKSE